MSSEFVKTYKLVLSPHAFFEKLRDSTFVTQRMESSKRQDPAVIIHSTAADVIRIVTRTQLSREELPAWMASRFPDGGPVNEREEIWASQAAVSAEVKVTAPTGGASFAGTYTLAETESGCDWNVEGSANFPAAFIGKRVEAFMLANLDMAFGREAEFVNVTAAAEVDNA